MARKVFKFPPGLCYCDLEHPYKESQVAVVHKVNTRGAVIEFIPGLGESDCISTTLRLTDGPNIPLLARVKRGSELGIVLQWLHNSTEEAKEFEAVLIDYVKAKVKPPPQNGNREMIKVDMGTAIRSKAMTVRSSDLAARHEKLQVLDMSTINKLIQAAVEEAVEVLDRPLAKEERDKLLKEAEQGFQAQIQAFQEQKRDIEAHVWKLQAQLENAQKSLREEKGKVIETDRFVVSDAGLAQLDGRLSSLLDVAIRKGKVSGKVEGEMREVISHLLDSERERAKDREKEAQSSRITLLERKVGRLARNLEETTAERDSAQLRAQALEEAGGGGLRNVYTPGLDATDPGREKKLELMKEIFQQNKLMREELEKRGVVFKKGEDADPSDSAETEAEEEVAVAGEVDSAQDTEGSTGLPEPEPDGVEEPVAQDDQDAQDDQGEPLVDPDDLPWEPPPPRDENDEQDASTVKRIVTKRVKPPPLERAGKPGEG